MRQGHDIILDMIDHYNAASLKLPFPSQYFIVVPLLEVRGRREIEHSYIVVRERRDIFWCRNVYVKAIGASVPSYRTGMIQRR